MATDTRPECVWRDLYPGVHGNHLELQKQLIVHQQ